MQTIERTVTDLNLYLYSLVSFFSFISIGMKAHCVCGGGGGGGLWFWVGASLTDQLTNIFLFGVSYQMWGVLSCILYDNQRTFLILANQKGKFSLW